MQKNPTPHQIAIRATQRMALSTLASFGLVFFLFRNKLSDPYIFLLCLGIGLLFTSITTYGWSMFYLDQFIFRKIKVIYKTIHNQKLNSVEKKSTMNIDMNANVLEDVEREVEKWAENYQNEVAQYNSWAEYRRKYIGDISHELKTPIFNIQGFVHTLLDGAINDQKVNAVFLEKAAKNIDRLQTIVEDLESISRLESGQLILDIRPFDIKELVEEVFEELSFKAEEKHIQLLFKEGAAVNYRIKADREYIRQVLLNLVSNSIKYGNEGGKTKVGFYDMDKNILIEVADNGIGIPKKHINHVFDRFYRVDKSRSREQGGSGLGLSIVKHIVEAHKQTINVRSTINLGSTFGFTMEKA